MSVIKLVGARYNVVTAGAGAPLMLLHGFTGSAESWGISSRRSRRDSR